MTTYIDIIISAARVNDILNRWVDEENRIHSGRYSGSKFPVPSIISSTFYQFTGIRFPELAFRIVHDSYFWLRPNKKSERVVCPFD